MRKIAGLFITVCLVFLSVKTNGQGRSLVDSLKYMLKDPPNDSVETRWVNSLFGLYISSNIDSALYYGDRAKELAQKTGDSVLIASNILNFGGYYWYQSDFTKAMECYVQAAEIFDKLGSETDKADAQMNIAFIYLTLGETAKSKPFFYKVLDIYERNKYWNGLSNAYQYLGAIFMEEPNYDSAIYCFKNCVEYAITSKMITNEAWGYSGLGEAYMKLGDMEESKKYQIKSLELEEQLGNKAGMLKSYISLGSLEHEMGNTTAAERYFVKAESMPELQTDWISQRNLYQEMMKLYEAMGQTSKAFSSYRKHVAARDSIRNSEDLATINELNEKYESEKKANEILSLQKDRELDQLTLDKERSQKTFFLIASALFLVLSSGLVFGYVQLRKSKGQVEKRNAMITKINKALNKTQNDLIDSNKTKDKFFALIAHDLRGPVTSLQGIGRMLAYYSSKGNESRIHELIAQVDASATSVNHLLDNLLKWALSQTDGLNYQPTDVELPDLLEEVSVIFSEALNAKEIEFRLEQEDRYAVKADYNMISTVLRNLLSNAIKFTPVGGEVSIIVSDSQESVQIAVKDSGSGIPADTLNQLVKNQVLKSTEGTQNEKGTGLGLLLCQEFVRKHGGELAIETADTGTTISFQLSKVNKTVEA
ncbi:tetratricopeptide repeat-containing sensor histidine kinase [Marinoscillum sp.]|uniref:tetratricopeptide repeat-containing sensor histidine kinase n=1 Tax=Marinoscillum sp. TaxID=2024838 RepID=UPI003BABE364